jgi:glucose/arabinose dehydrogenase
MVVTHWTRRLGTALAATLAFVVLTVAPASADLPTIVAPGFQDVPLATDLTAPTTVRFAPAMDNRMFVALKSGVVLAYDEPQDSTPTQVIDLSTEVDDFWDRGLLGMALAPGFSSNGGYMYLLYARDALIGGTAPRWNDQCGFPPGATESGCVISGELVRVMIGPLGVATGQPETIIQDQWCQQFPSHSVGTVAFGPDGMLYVSAGEGANFNAADWGQWGGDGPTPVNPCGDPYFPADSDASEGGALRAQDVRTNGDPAGLSGAVLRIDPATGAAATGNPFSASPDPNKKRVIAYGMRNPFRFTFRPGTSDLWIGDVGWTQIEEIDEINAADGAAENLGWPCYEGSSVNPDYDQQDLCRSLPAGQVTMPKFSYSHTGEVIDCDGCSDAAGSSISGLAFYGSGGYPDSYDDGLFFADYARNCVWFAPRGASGDPDFDAARVFARGPGGVGPVELQTAPNGNLLYVFHHQDFGEIHEVRPVDAPTARITVTDHGGGDFTFDASQSSGLDRTYAWDLDNNGTFDPGETGVTADMHWDGRPNPAPSVRLRVTSYGLSDVTSVKVSVGNTIPHDAQIAATVPSGGWSVGDNVHVSASAVDPDAEDQGHLTYTWTLTILHCPGGAGCHNHPVETRTGPTADFTAPSHEYPSRLEVGVTATDTLGFSAHASIELQPRVVTLTTRATPAPLTVSLGGADGNSVTTALIAGTATTAATTTPQAADGQTYLFMGWSDGDKRLSRPIAPRADTVLTARFLSEPGAKAPPGIRGTSRTRHTLRARTGDWLGNELTYAYQWLRCAPGCRPIGGATAAKYRVRDADLGKRLAVRVTARNDLGSATQQSAETAKILEGVPPKVRLAGAKRVRLGDGRLKLKVACPSERCRLSVRAVLLVKGHKAGATRAVNKTLGRGKKATLTVRLSARLRRTALKALKAHKKVTVRFDVTARDALSNRATSHRTVRLRR